ncbi:MAG: exodeoxyribonuclease V subunit beta [Magnetococcales bacterium]|nr:exodeoxyribonuclease V subunit beta [Magnetococcales bacterium]
MNNPPTPPELDPLRFPLLGRHLIEASAGTGKTYTIALLYLRLVLGHDGAGIGRDPLTPPEILVVTFTKAATRELRERIRLRLAEAARCFRAASDEENTDSALLALRAEYPPERWPGAARRLQLAAEWMDEAAVDTIHGWCNRMLREHAFDTDSLFTQELAADQQELLAEVVRDYWRSFLTPLTVALAREVHPFWPGIERLHDEVRRLRPQSGLLEESATPEAILGVGVALKARLNAGKSRWPAWIAEMRTLFEEGIKTKSADGRKIQARYYEPWLQTLAGWAADPHQPLLELTDSAWRRLSPEGIAEAWKSTPPHHPAFAALVTIRQEQQQLDTLHHRLLAHATRWIATRFAHEKDRRAVMEFDDVLRKLDSVLQGANGAHLATLLRQQFPVALIDEFQDTDPVQYRIFNAIYPDHTGGRDGSALILIGDPKQAIYAFRGADIHTYLQARRLEPTRIHTLKTNYRSTPAMVGAVNTLFGAAEKRAGGGAFLQRGTDDNPIPFVAIEARGVAERLIVNRQAQPAMTLWWSNGTAEELAAGCASAMVALLNLGQSGEAGFLEATGEWRSLKPSDLAVLVHGRRDYEAMRGALQARGVRCVYLSDKESVFQTPRAHEVRHWLAACATPEDPRLIRTALATATLGLPWAAIDALNHDETLLERRIQQFRAYQLCWQRQGVLPMLRRLLHDFAVPARLLDPDAIRETDGERILTDLLHLAELLQKSSAARAGELALIRELDQQISGNQEDAMDENDRLIRLESDAELVRIVTVHKSKGLEYPLVFFPFASRCRPVTPRDLPGKWRDPQGRERLAFDDPDGTVIDALEQERLREELRKLYVATTRARHATWMAVQTTGPWNKSALRHLLTDRTEITPEELPALLAPLQSEHILQAEPAPVPSDTRFQPQASQSRTIGRGRHARRAVREPWWIGSYSALVAKEATPEAPENPEEERFRELHGRERAEALSSLPTGTDQHAFPRGAKAGIFLHELLAWCGTQGFGRVAAQPEALQAQVTRRCQARGWSQWSAPLTAWLLRLLTTPLDLAPLTGQPTPLRLDEITTCQVEMEFLVTIQNLATARIDPLVRAHLLPGLERPPLLEKSLHGLLKGFMDLVFEHQGRYYVLDYKSNHLGAEDAAYTPAAMQAEMLHARYDLQYLFYIFALHRHLQARLPDYDYDRHIGGAIHLFLRGIDAPGRGVYADRPPREVIELVFSPLLV